MLQQCAGRLGLVLDNKNVHGMGARQRQNDTYCLIDATHVVKAPYGGLLWSAGFSRPDDKRRKSSVSGAVRAHIADSNCCAAVAAGIWLDATCFSSAGSSWRMRGLR